MRRGRGNLHRLMFLAGVKAGGWNGGTGIKILNIKKNLDSKIAQPITSNMKYGSIDLDIALKKQKKT
jgi:hypothetical protein